MRSQPTAGDLVPTPARVRVTVTATVRTPGGQEHTETTTRLLDAATLDNELQVIFGTAATYALIAYRELLAAEHDGVD